MAKPVILFVPGSFALPSFYDTVIHAIAAQGYSIRALHCPSVGLVTGPREGALPSMYDDAAFIAAEVEKLADEGEDVVLVAHSYGGVPTSQCTKGLAKHERLAVGKQGGVVRIAYMAAVVPAVGVSTMAVLGDIPQEQKLETDIDASGWMFMKDPVKTAAICYNDLSTEEGVACVQRFPGHSSLSFAGELSHPGYKDTPVSWLLTERDLCVPPNTQRTAIAMIEQTSGRKVDVTSIESDHCPNAGKPQVVSDWILEVVSKAQAVA